MKYTYDIDIPYFETDEIYSSNGIKVVSEGYMKNADGDRVLFLEVQNNSENMIYFQTSDLKVNEKNYMMVHGAMIVFWLAAQRL